MTNLFLHAGAIGFALAISGCSNPERQTPRHNTASIDAVEVGTILADDGVRISYTSEGHGEPAIVFIHGWTCDRTHWQFQVPEFRKSFRVITLDLAGHGASGADRDSWSIDGFGADVATVVRSLKLKQVVLVGHSLGGPVVLAAAPRLRGILQGIVVVDSVHDAEFSYSPEATNRMVKRFEDDFDGAWTRFMSSFFEDPDSDILKSILEKPNKTNRKAATLLLADYNRFDLKSALTAANVPVRAINAATPYPTAIETNRKYGDFDAILIPNVGHFLMLENPAEFNRHLRITVDRLQAK